MKSGNGTKQRILSVAARLFREKGYQAATLRNIAKETGIQGGSVYHHFDSKQQCLFSIMETTLTELIELIRHKIETSSDPMERLRIAIEQHIKYHINHIDNTYVTDTELRSLPPENLSVIMEKRKKYEDLFKNLLISAAHSKGTEIINIKLTTFATLQMCTGLSLWFKQGGTLSIEEATKIYYRLIVSFITQKLTDDF